MDSCWKNDFHYARYSSFLASLFALSDEISAMNAKPTMALTLDARLTLQGNVHIQLLQLSGEVAACLELPPCTLVSELEPLAVAAVGNPDRRVSLVLPGGKVLLRHFPADHRLETLLQ